MRKTNVQAELQYETQFFSVYAELIKKRVFPIRITGFQRRQRADHLMSYAKALKKTQCESIKTIMRKRRLLCSGGRTADEQ